MATTNIRSALLPGQPPRKPGLYAVLLRLPPAVRLTANDPDIARRNITALVQRLQATFGRTVFEGSLHERDKGIPGLHLEVDATERANRALPLPLGLDAFDFYELLLLAAPLMRPVYVGITSEQTIDERIEQHRRDFEGDVDANVFGRRARARGLAWSDLAIGWIAAESPQEVAALRPLEVALHGLIRPPLSGA